MTRVWWWIERFSMYLVMVYFVKLLNVDCGLARKHPWIGNSRGGVVLGIHNVIAMCCWWATSLFVKLKSHILFCMHVCPKICVPLGICWLCIIQFISLLRWCAVGYWDWVLCVFSVGFGEDICVEGSPLVCHIENNLKWPIVFMRVK